MGVQLASAPSGQDPSAKTKILCAAIDLSGEHGFDRVTVKDGALKAGVSAPLVIHHFSSKAGLRSACDAYVAEQFRRTKTESVRRGHMPRNVAHESTNPEEPPDELAANRAQLLDGMVDAVFAEIWLPAPEAEWRESMRRRAESARETLNRHRWAVSLMDSRKHPGPATLRHHDAVLGCLRGNGFTVPQAANAVSVLDSYVYGFVLQEAALPFTTSEELDELAESIFAELPKDEFPHFTELAVEHALKPGYSYSDEFDFGVTLILDGLSRIRTP
ncbi:TetR/AcrR family transcriptional regulator [Nesterenkonia massiliensis]|uniref:TetR/AcrR family transcriptional regulator n=1 Tax=Nesterenkonia massiliensis TaxID=1232429 RepID=UPI002D21BE08|nr:TetR/AcrR family transcriptional regulator [Nesterenkonia massiliensis]